MAWLIVNSQSSIVNPLSYQLIPNIILLFSILGILLLVLRRLPEASAIPEQPNQSEAATLKLLAKGLPAMAISKLRSWFRFWGKKLWNFALEAKDLKPQAFANYRIRKLFGPWQQPKPATSRPASTEEVQNEQYFLNIIKRDPKNLANYDLLGRFYLDHQEIDNARDIYDYLTRHDAANADYQARLAYCYYQTKDFAKTAEHYQKSLALDSSQPNRYYNLGLVQETMGQSEAALQSISRAIALEPHNARYYLSFGNISLKLGRHDEALNALQKAYELEPQNDKVKQKLDRLNAKQ